MRQILSANQHRSADMRASALGIPSMVLMERAALAVVEEMEKAGLDLSRALIFCGSGNNAGDGAAIARLLAERGLHPVVFACGDPAHYSEQMALQMHILESFDVSVIQAVQDGWSDEELLDKTDFSSFSVIVDAIFGIGVSREITGFYKHVIDTVNARRGSVPVVAVDMPSGVHTDSGAICGTALRADLTVTFTTGKAGLYLYPGASYAGRVAVRKIGIPVPADMQAECDLFELEDADIRQIPPRDEAGNKGTFKKLLVIAGSADIFGAAFLSAKAALLSGIGMVKVLTHEKNRTPLATLLPEALLATYDEKTDIATILSRDLAWADAVLAGPGLGTGPLSLKVLQTCLEQNSRLFSGPLPMVLDADALNLIAAHQELMGYLSGQIWITPHIGEMSRLTGYQAEEIKAHAVRVARQAAVDASVVVMMKDARTVTALPDGRCLINRSGSSALATAGSGDVLSGIAAAFLALYGQEVHGVPTAALAVYIHGKCGERAGSVYSKSSATAGNILGFIHEFLP